MFVEQKASGFLQLSLQEYASLKTELIWVYDSEPHNQQMTVNRTPDFGTWAWFLKQGSLELHADDKDYLIEAGQWLMLPEGHTKHRFSPDSQLVSVHYRCQWPSGENLLIAPNLLRFEAEQYNSLLEKAAVLEHKLRKQFPSVSSPHSYSEQFLDYSRYMDIHIDFLVWLRVWQQAAVENGALWTRLGTGDDRALRAARCLNSAPIGEGFPHELLNKETNLSQIHLDRVFTQTYQITTRKYWEKRRLKTACDCLHDPDVTIKQLAYHLGFKSDSLFINWFRRLTGQSPGQYRKESFVYSQSVNS